MMINPATASLRASSHGGYAPAFPPARRIGKQSGGREMILRGAGGVTRNNQ